MVPLCCRRDETNPEDVEPGGGFRDNLNPDSLEALKGVKVESSLASAEVGSRFQFLRQGYFCVDPDSRAGKLVFNRTVTLRDTWAKIEKSLQEGKQGGGSE